MSMSLVSYTYYVVWRLVHRRWSTLPDDSQSANWQHWSLVARRCRLVCGSCDRCSFSVAWLVYFFRLATPELQNRASSHFET